MQTRKLGNSDLDITPLGIGAWAMGGPGYAFAWGEQDDGDSVAAIQHALDLGINWIDTAAVYGLGHSEEIVARAIKGRESPPYVFTKCERVWNAERKISGVLKRDSIRRECEASLRRLQTDVIDLYQIHWPDPDEDIEEGWTALAELKEEGKVRNIGVSNFNVAQMTRAQEIAPITSLQPPYNAIRRDIEAEILPYCLANDIGVIAYSPMASGLLTGTMTAERVHRFPADDWRSRSPQFIEPALSANLAIAERLGTIADAHGRTTAEAAIAWVLRHPAVTGAIVGLRNPAQADGVIGAMDFRLTDEEMARAAA
jgi:aryl-alcohol dehydrogenase-like predicted oxidoreductase